MASSSTQEGAGWRGEEEQQAGTWAIQQESGGQVISKLVADQEAAATALHVADQQQLQPHRQQLLQPHRFQGLGMKYHSAVSFISPPAIRTPWPTITHPHPWPTITHQSAFSGCSRGWPFLMLQCTFLVFALY